MRKMMMILFGCTVASSLAQATPAKVNRSTTLIKAKKPSSVAGRTSKKIAPLGKQITIRSTPIGQRPVSPDSIIAIHDLPPAPIPFAVDMSLRIGKPLPAGPANAAYRLVIIRTNASKKVISKSTYFVSEDNLPAIVGNYFVIQLDTLSGPVYKATDLGGYLPISRPGKRSEGFPIESTEIYITALAPPVAPRPPLPCREIPGHNCFPAPMIVVPVPEAEEPELYEKPRHEIRPNFEEEPRMFLPRTRALPTPTPKIESLSPPQPSFQLPQGGFDPDKQEATPFPMP